MAQTNLSDDDQIPNADKIIQRFGGIRPMAGKMNVPVTTVQGWKKRNVIPGNRRDDIMSAAKANKVSLSGVEDLLAASAPSASKSTANENAAAPAAKIKAAKPAAAKIKAKASKASKASKAQGKPAMTDQPKKPVASSQPAAKPSAQPSVQPSAQPAVKSPVSGAPVQNPVKRPAASQPAKPQAPQTAPVRPAQASTAAQSSAPRPTTSPQQHAPKLDATQRHNATVAELKAMSDRAIKRSLMFSGSLIAIALVVGFVMFSGDDVKRVEEDLTAIQSNVGTLETRTTMLEKALPQNLTENLQTLKQDAQLLKQTVGTLAQDVQTAAQTLTDESQGTVIDRIAALEGQVGQMGSGESLGLLMTRIDSLSQTINGQQQLSAAMGDLSQVVQGLQGQMDGFDAALEQAKLENNELAKTLEGVTGRDLGAAAMLLALGQFRSSVNRNAPFEEDLAILRKIVGEDDVELNAALDRLAPYAEEGVLSPENLKEELKTLSGDIVMARLAGQDVSIKEKALIRLGEVISVSKDGQPITGTPEEAAIIEAQALLDAGDVQGAMAALSALEGPAADAAAPWMEKAQGHVEAQSAEELILQTVLQHLSGTGGKGLLGGIGMDGGMPTAESLGQGMRDMGLPKLGGSGASVYTDPNSGISIMKKGGTPWPIPEGQ